MIMEKGKTIFEGGQTVLDIVPSEPVMIELLGQPLFE